MYINEFRSVCRKTCEKEKTTVKMWNLNHDESLMTEVQKFPCLYDKSDRGFKEKDRILNAWREIDTALQLEEGKLFVFIRYRATHFTSLFYKLIPFCNHHFLSMHR